MTEQTKPKADEKADKTVALKSLYQKLSIPINKEFLTEYEQDGEKFKGYQSQYAIDLLNEVIGLGNWHAVMDIRKEEYIGRGWVVAGTLTILIEYEGFEFAVNGGGGSYAKDIANAYKGFKTSAFKNACKYLGIGKELYYESTDDDIVIVEPKTEVKEEVVIDNELANKIEAIKTITELDALKDAIMATEGINVKNVLIKKYNDKKMELTKK